MQPTMRQMTQQQTGQFMQPGLMQQQQQMPSNMPGMQTQNMASVNTGMQNMNLGPGMMSPMSSGMAASNAGMMRNTGMMGNTGMVGNANMGMNSMQYNYQTMGMRMPMQAPVYQTAVPGNMGKFKS